MIKFYVSFFVALMIGFIPFSPGHASTEMPDIIGSVGLTEEDGEYNPGQMVTVFLVTEDLKIPEKVDTNGLNAIEKVERLNKYHMEFFKAFWKKTLNPEYFVTQTVSNDDGTFRFENIKLGEYFVLVVFPTMVGGKKVTWQVPVVLENKNGVHVTLDNGNLSLPAFSRYSLPPDIISPVKALAREPERRTNE